MPAWPGGPCPECGDDMPPNLITCQTCRALLNSDLQQTYVDIPEFIPLEEITLDEQSDSQGSVVTKSPVQPQTSPVILIEAKGIFRNCPKCREELKVPRAYLNQSVCCNHCQAPFVCDATTVNEYFVASYVDCPHCSQRIRASREFTNQNVLCNHCSQPLHIQLQ